EGAAGEGEVEAPARRRLGGGEGEAGGGVDPPAVEVEPDGALLDVGLVELRRLEGDGALAGGRGEDEPGEGAGEAAGQAAAEVGVARGRGAVAPAEGHRLAGPQRRR